MGKGISISIAADTKDAKRGIQTGLIEPLEDASEALDSLADEGQNAGRILERAFSEQQRETEQLRKEYDKLGDTIRQSGRRGRDFGDDIETGTNKAKRGLDDLKSESNETAREVAASFDGSAESIAEGFQEVAANAFGGFGPLAVAAGLAAAGGLGVISTELRTQQEEADELKARLTDAYIAAAEEGRNYLSVQQIIEESKAIYEDPERAAEALRVAKELTIDRSLVVQAMAGDEDAIAAIIAAATDKERERRDILNETIGVQGNRVAVADEEIRKLDQIRGKFEEQLGLQNEAKANAEEYLGVIDAQNAKQAEGNDAAKRAVDERGKALEEYGRQAASIPNPVLVPQLDTRDFDARVEEIRRRRYSIGIDIVLNERRGTQVQ